MKKNRYKPKKDCRMYRPPIGDQKPERCDGLMKLFCAEEGKCKFYKPEEGTKP